MMSLAAALMIGVKAVSCWKGAHDENVDTGSNFRRGDRRGARLGRQAAKGLRSTRVRDADPMPGRTKLADERTADVPRVNDSDLHRRFPSLRGWRSHLSRRPATRVRARQKRRLI